MQTFAQWSILNHIPSIRVKFPSCFLPCYSVPMTSPSDLLQQLIQRFAASECSWLTTVRPNGRPHIAPVWHVWFQHRAWVVTTACAVKVANIRQNPHVVITDTNARHPIIIEGLASIAPEAEADLRPLFLAKYDWDIRTDEAYDTIIAIRPVKVLAWGEQDGRRWSHRWRWRD